VDGITPVTFAFSTGLASDRFITTPDGEHVMFVGTLAGATLRSVLVLDNLVVVKNGLPPAPGVSDCGTVTNFDLLPNGDWYAWGGYAGGPGFWCLKNGELIARTGDTITNTSTERWGNSIYGATGNRNGDFVIAGSTDSGNTANNEVIVVNNDRVI